MADDTPGARDEAERHFARLRDDKTASASKRVDAARMKADSDKTARLKAARLAKAEEASPPQSAENTCRTCGGSGRAAGGECPECGGSGLIQETVGDA